jgi:hypothetical protein
VVESEIKNLPLTGRNYIQLADLGAGTSPSPHSAERNTFVYSTKPASKDAAFRWRDNAPQPGKTSYYYVRGEQENGEIEWASPP